MISDNVIIIIVILIIIIRVFIKSLKYLDKKRPSNTFYHHPHQCHHHHYLKHHHHDQEQQVSGQKTAWCHSPLALTCKLQSVTLNQIWMIVIVVTRITVVVNFLLYICQFIVLGNG